MYFLFGLFAALCIAFVFLNHRRKKRIICKVRCMDICEKQQLLNEQIQPFGFTYDSGQDVFTATVDAWQRQLGYRALFDRNASRFNMVFDCELVYFDYDCHTWLIEFWKGQYGINIGGEIGIYRADKIVSPGQYPYTQFYPISDQQMLPLAMRLEYGGQSLFTIQQLHWWLAGFRMGLFTWPRDLTMHAALTFPNDTMMHSFLKSLKQLGYHTCSYRTCDHTVSWTFTRPHAKRQGLFLGVKNKVAQWQNRLFIKLYYHVTRPFSCTADRLLYLYYFLPFAFRRAVGIRSRYAKAGKYRHSVSAHSFMDGDDL